jgi:1-acyl-sn-glycerol-3-phosphate acyltransferase
VVYWFFWVVAHILVRLFYRVSFSGGGNIPREGPVLVCVNHLAWWDPLLVGMACRRQIHFMAQAELFRGWSFPLGLLLRAVGAYPVKRDRPDRKALDRTLELLRQGRAVCVFPEGAMVRKGKMRRAEPGVGFIVMKTGVPVVAAHITRPSRLRSPVKLTVGRPKRFIIDPEASGTGKQRRQAIADAIMREITVLGGRPPDDYPVPDGERWRLPRVLVCSTAPAGDHPAVGAHPPAHGGNGALRGFPRPTAAGLTTRGKNRLDGGEPATRIEEFCRAGRRA